jgi:hypothetical protein
MPAMKTGWVKGGLPLVTSQEKPIISVGARVVLRRGGSGVEEWWGRFSFRLA